LPKLRLRQVSRKDADDARSRPRTMGGGFNRLAQAIEVRGICGVKGIETGALEDYHKVSQLFLTNHDLPAVRRKYVLLHYAKTPTYNHLLQSIHTDCMEVVVGRRWVPIRGGGDDPPAG